MLTEPFTFVQSCMGRLAHLRVTVPLVLERTKANLCIVDYSCPDKTAEWVRWNYSQEPRVLLVESPGHDYFNKCAALNLGHHAVAEKWPGFQATLDADTLVTEELWQWFEEHVCADRFYFVEGSREARDLSGLLVMHTSKYLESGGYDEWFECWGGEDFDMRCRMYLKVKLPYEMIPATLASAIPHSNAERVVNYSIKNIEGGHYRNQRRILSNINQWVPRPLRAISQPEVRRLFGMPDDPEFGR